MMQNASILHDLLTIRNGNYANVDQRFFLLPPELYTYI